MEVLSSHGSKLKEERLSSNPPFFGPAGQLW